MAERQPSKLHVAGSNPVSRSTSLAETNLRLRRALDRAIPRRDGIEVAVAGLSSAYRSSAAAPVLDDDLSAAAYAASRMPATLAAAGRALVAVAERAPSFAPGSLLDLGAGTGSTAWAARAVWPSLGSMTLVDRSRTATGLGRRIAGASGDPVLEAIEWRIADAAPGAREDLRRADLVTAGYLLGELPAGAADAVVDRLWAATRGVLVLVEPGSRAGYRRVLAARDRLLRAGARVVAPCPGPEPCPVAGSRTTWCHFLARLDRSPRQRRSKAALRSWEDEPFGYVAVARPGVVADPWPRVVLGRPRHLPGRVEVRICAGGRIETRVVSRREGDAWRTAKDLEWGDAIEPRGDSAG